MGALVILMLGAYLAWFAPESYRAEDKILFTVERGETAADIIANLSAQEFIRSPFGARIAFALTGTRAIQPGTYNVSPRMDVWQIAYIIARNRTATVKTTIPEGYTIQQIGALLAKQDIVGADDFRLVVSNFPPDFDWLVGRSDNSLEGYLFPDTSNLNRGTPARELVLTVLDNFRSRIATVDAQVESSKYTLHQILTLASLVEKEARTDEDRKLIAGVLINRLNKGMRLDVDATVRYITGNWTDPITNADLNINSPYNTRKVTGLPPGPICNPGLAAIKAVLSPTSSGYLYYLHGPDGNTYYAKTLGQHNANKAEYL